MKSLLSVFAPLILLPVTLAANFSVTPFFLNFTSSTAGNARFLEVYHLNRNNRPIAIELVVRRREVDLDGKTLFNDTVDVSGNFMIYPERIILLPKERQRVQIRYVGDPAIFTTENVFAILATEIAVDEPRSVEPTVPAGQLVLTSRYAVLAVMKPDRPRPSVKVDTVYSVKNGSGQQKMVVILSNSGTGMQKLDNMVITLHGKEKSSKYTIRPQVDPEIVKNSLFPGYRRKLEFPWPSQVPAGDVRGMVSFGN